MWSRTRLSISFRTLYSRLKRYKIDPTTKAITAERMVFISSGFERGVDGMSRYQMQQTRDSSANAWVFRTKKKRDV